ncbi:MAG: helix-turn-helix transcriptional regulator [Oscillospiraceae bacterium]|nr:helix-turn-helix transcriptional regulator [Oscillospiraceae bacterium]
MVDVNRLRGLIAERGLSQRKVAKLLGMAEKTFYSKMKSGVFVSTEMSALIELLDISDPAGIFFTELVSR